MASGYVLYVPKMNHVATPDVATPDEEAEREKEFQALMQKFRQKKAGDEQADRQQEEDEQAAKDAANATKWAENWRKKAAAKGVSGEKGVSGKTLAQMRACLESM